MATLGSYSITLTLICAGLALPARAVAGDPPAGGKTESSDTAGDTAKSGTIPAAFLPFVYPAPASMVVAPKPVETGVDWGELGRESVRFLVIEHGFRLATEPGTRAGLKGPFLRNYGRAVGNLHGIADGDEFYVNYVGHPMEGGVAGFLFAQNDRAYRRAEFGTSAAYWKGKLRAGAFAWLFSTQFEIGPVSEASIGGIQAQYPQVGFVDHVITPSIGMAWMIGEDVMDKYVIERIEAATTNPYVRFLARGGLNPARSFANVLGGRVPWSRDTRPGVKSYVARDERRYAFDLYRTAKREPNPGDSAVVAPFEFSITFQPERFMGGKGSLSCLGGGGTVGLRLAPSWQLMADVGGCNLMGLETNLSGDTLTYMAGPRWNSRIAGRWSAYVQVLAGGNKVSEERMRPELKQLLEKIAVRDHKQPPSHDDYTEATESNGFAMATGGGLHYNLHPALTLRVAELSYRHSWTAPLWGRDYSNGLKWSSGLVLRMGTW